MLNSTAWSRSLPIFSGRSQRCSVISSKPAIFSCSLTVSALAIENGPGPQVGSSVSSGCSRYSSTTCSARWTHSLSSLRRQTTAQSRPPGPAPRGRCAAPHRVGEEHDPHPREGVVEALAELERLHVGDREVGRSSAPASSASSRAASMNGSETSTPSASPSGPTSSASRWVVSPKPQPRSMTRSPGRGGWAASPPRRGRRGRRRPGRGT